jgi:hypothetical protein
VLQVAIVYTIHSLYCTHCTVLTVNMFQWVLQSCPWLPIIGNHEAQVSQRFQVIDTEPCVGMKPR